MRVLFVTWDAPTASYVESLFLPAFVELKKHGVDIDILQFCWNGAEARQALALECARHGIGYMSINVSRWPNNFLGTIFTIVKGRWLIPSAIRRFRPDVLMPRGLFPAFAVLWAGGNKLRPLIFDSDGLEADSRVEGDTISQSGLSYRVLREVEAQAARISEAVLVRTGFNAHVIRVRAGPRVSADHFQVMTCGRDPETFKPLKARERHVARESLGLAPSDPLLVYVGSVWPQYRTADVARFAAAVKRRAPLARLMVLTGQPEEARDLLAEGDPEIAADAIVMKASPKDVPRLIGAADVGFSLFQVGFGSRAQSPIKLGEYLLCGVPVIGTAAVGDTGPAIAAGLFLDDSEGAESAADWLLNDVIPNRDAIGRVARRIGVECFSLDRTVKQYLEVFESVGRRVRLEQDPSLARSAQARMGIVPAGPAEQQPQELSRDARAD